ncbi:dihydrofolate reductase [Salinisphaera sp. T31B1]|uniref:dihydrofolate reductase n=1 Tax=Salinisphaera sp. T31B1 TaxID=727963 RepID=UPI00333FC8B5
MSSYRPRITLIAAMDRNRVIGANGGMPWHIPTDLRWFKQQTLDRPILMGRRTYESIGRALPRRLNLVLTRDTRFTAPGVERVASLAEAIERTRAAEAEELAVIGGAEVYALALPRADRLKITRIEAEYDGDTWFPSFEAADWRCIDDQAVDATEDTPAHRFMTWDRDSP